MVVTDLDNTFLDASKQVTKENKERVKALRKKGIYFGFASGRSVDRLLEDLEGWGMDSNVDFLIGVNGNTVYDFHTDQRFDYYPVSGQTCLEIIDFFSDLDVSPKPMLNGKRYTNVSTRASRDNAHMYNEEEVELDLDAFLKENDVDKMMFYFDPKIRDQVYQRVLTYKNPDVTYAFSAPELLDFQYHLVDKGFGLEKISELYQIDLREIMAFGDAENDIPMLEKAGISVGMKNAQDRVKETVDFTTKRSNDDSGFAHFLEDEYGDLG